MYADDTSITCSAKDIEELCNELKTEGKNIAEWMRQNKAWFRRRTFHAPN